MCQTIADGGRRCPIHMHQNIAAIKVAAHTSGLTRYQTERLFAELSREGRGAENDLTQPEQHQSRLNALRAQAAGTSLEESINTHLASAAEHDRPIDAATAYAQNILQERAVDRATNLNNFFNAQATRLGISATEVKERFAIIMNEVPSGRNVEIPEEYNANTRRYAAEQNLPYDRASVVALERIKRIGSGETRARVLRTAAREGSNIATMGYHEGRLEVSFRSNPDNVYAYQNVPEDVWERLARAERPGSVYVRSIRGNQEYMYASAEEAEADSTLTRCGSCGQFASQTGHSCPVSVRREELAATGLTGEQIREQLADENSTNSDVVAALSDENVSSVDEPVAEEPVVETVPAETEAELAATPEPATEPFVLALPDETARNIFSETMTRTPTTGFTREDAEGEWYGEELYTASAPVSAMTLEEQLNPSAVPEDSNDILELNAENVVLVSKNHINRLSWSGFTETPQSMINKIRNSPEDIYYIFSKVTENGVTEEKIVGTYDSKLFTGSTRHGDWDSERGTYPTYFTLKRRGHKASDGRLGNNVVQAREERTAEKTVATEHYTTLSQSENFVQVPVTASRTKRYIYDASEVEGYKTAIAMPYVAALRRALNENKVVGLKLDAVYDYRRSGSGIDDQGYETEDLSSSGKVEGFVAVRKNASGALEIISKRGTLKCECYDYRQKYYCAHINHAERHYTNALAQHYNGGQVAGGTVSARLDASQNPTGLLNRALVQRGDVTAVQPEPVNGVPVDPYLSFGEELGTNTVSEYIYQSRRRMSMPTDLRLEGELSWSSLIKVRDFYALANAVHDVTTPVSPTAIRNALKRGNTETPVKVKFAGIGRDNGLVTGSIIYKKTDTPATAEVLERKLKCTCEKYQETYDCVHVRFVADQRAMILGVKSTEASNMTVESENRISSWERTHSQQLRRAHGALEVHDANPDMSYEEALAESDRLAAERARVEEERRVERERVRAEQRRIEQERRIQMQREEVERLNRVNAATVAATTAQRERMLAQWENVEGKYSDNPEQFFDDYKAALAAKSSGQSPLVFRTENVTDGICAPVDGARRFGVELEFDIQEGQSARTVRQKIGRALVDAGLTSNSSQQGYHSGSRTGWREWTFESDCTVAGEVVSPILSDTPEDWEQIRKVCEIINENGGKASTKTGSHVSVSSASYERSTAKHGELLRSVNQNEDIMFRLASSPKRGKHRGLSYCSPNTDDSQHDISPELQQGYNLLGSGASERGAINFAHTAQNSYGKNRVEFRMWDATLDPAVIQHQILVSVAMTEAAERNVIKGNGSKKPTEARAFTGTFKEKEQGVLESNNVTSHNAETFKEANGHVGSFIDNLVRRPEDRKAIASLFAVTNWQEGTRNSRNRRY